MSTSPSNLKLALDAYDAQQRRQAALVEAERIGTLIHIQEQQLLAAKYLAKQRKSQRRRVSANNNLNVSQSSNESSGECAIEDEEEDLVFEPVLPATTVPICPSLAARRAARSASKRVSHSLLESIPEPDAEPSEAAADGIVSSYHDNDNSNNNIRWATHNRRPQEPFASLASRSQWKPDSNARVCDNTLCKKPFSLFGQNTRHHCRRCGNVFCAECLTHTEVLYDMQRSQWDAFPEALLASIFPPVETKPQEQRPLSSPALSSSSSSSSSPGVIPTSPASSTGTNLSSSVDSGSSRASTSSSSYFPIVGKYSYSSTTTGTGNSNSSNSSTPSHLTDPLHSIQRLPTWHTGTNNALLPTPIPPSWRDALLDISSVEKVCEECHDELWDRPGPVERAAAKRAFVREREEMAWALRVVGLDKWDEVLRGFGLTFKARRKERRGSESTVVSGSTTKSQHHRRHRHSRYLDNDEHTMPLGAPGVKPEIGRDFMDRPTYPHVYAWVTPPPCIRFTSSAFKPSPEQQPDFATTTSTSTSTTGTTGASSTEAPTPSPFGMLKSPAKFLPPPLPASYLAAQAAAAQHALQSLIPHGEARESLRHTRYSSAVKELVRIAYSRGVPCEEHLYGGVRGVVYLVERTPLEVVKGEVVKKALDLAARWRGDPVGC